MKQSFSAAFDVRAYVYDRIESLVGFRCVSKVIDCPRLEQWIGSKPADLKT